MPSELSFTLDGTGSLMRTSLQLFCSYAVARVSSRHIIESGILAVSSCFTAKRMSTRSRQYRPSRFDDVEDIESYTTGGFHPVHLGDLFQDRYKILHKLGYGGFSTVWLALDEQKHRRVALKIMRAEASSHCSELEILQRLGRSPNDASGRKNVTSLFDHFTIDGPNGTHMCLVSDVAGPSVAALNDCPGKVAGSRRLRSDLARKIAKQTVEALKFVHSHKLCHGDITASNLLFQLASINEWSEDEVCQRFGEPRKDLILTISGCEPGRSAPRYLVESANLLDPRFLAEDILLVDFGQSFVVDNPPQAEDIGIPFSYCAPEVIFDSKVSKCSEIWALGCVIFELRAGQQLFPSWSGGQDEILRQMVQTLGILPDGWWNAWEKRTNFFNDDGKPKQEWSDGIPKAVEYPISEIIGDIGSEDEEEKEPRKSEAILEPSGTSVPLEEAAQMNDLLDRIFKWAPEERISLDDILNHSWFGTKHKDPF
ncbi:Kinase-like protein [Venustampulla echinocandica]|uniref:EKC/KEOPS complex subunit BUD32 n=1 Tax=Venustampulla echinocandica TaxID=2656787 RepID=A0A370TS73_9HELO|nr:Kinase-like protein [Venustampulla echinocandica]RDL38376.1 Kinase-like protein [Venustampulla echinocandica]